MVRIEIKKKGNKTAILITFHSQTDKFESASERNRFFSELYGRKQTIPKENKKYIYYRKGLLDSVNHIKVDSSVFIVAMQHLKLMEQFFKEWEDKVIVRKFPVIIDNKQSKELEREVEIE